MMGEKTKKLCQESVLESKTIWTIFESIQAASDKKYHRIKIKIKKGKDIEILKAVRKTFPSIRLMADANADYALEDTTF